MGAISNLFGCFLRHDWPKWGPVVEVDIQFLDGNGVAAKKLIQTRHCLRCNQLDAVVKVVKAA